MKDLNTSLISITVAFETLPIAILLVLDLLCKGRSFHGTLILKRVVNACVSVLLHFDIDLELHVLFLVYFIPLSIHVIGVCLRVVVCCFLLDLCFN